MNDWQASLRRDDARRLFEHAIRTGNLKVIRSSSSRRVSHDALKRLIMRPQEDVLNVLLPRLTLKDRTLLALNVLLVPSPNRLAMLTHIVAHGLDWAYKVSIKGKRESYCLTKKPKYERRFALDAVEQYPVWLQRYELNGITTAKTHVETFGTALLNRSYDPMIVLLCADHRIHRFVRHVLLESDWLIEDLLDLVFEYDSYHCCVTV